MRIADHSEGQSSVSKAYHEFLMPAGRMRPSAYYDRVVDGMEGLVKFTLLTRDVAALTDRYSERKEAAAKLDERLDLGRAVR